MNKVKFSVRQINNGWLLKILCYGKTALKEPYEDCRDEIYVQQLCEVPSVVLRLTGKEVT